jgi:hypothetical protein
MGIGTDQESRAGARDALASRQEWRQPAPLAVHDGGAGRGVRAALSRRLAAVFEASEDEN